MNYSRFQKWLSSFLIFSILFLQTFEVPMLDSTRAEAKINTDIVSLIVDEDIYSGIVKAKISQYAKDIQVYLPNTRVVILPVSKTINPFTIASTNEKLFYEGDGAGLSRLIGTILIGEVPLPIVHKEGKAFMSVYPYVDFDSKSFLYDQTKKSYDYTTQSLTDEKPEIWHSVIRPNTGTESKNKDELVLFFNKTHDFYNKQGLFSALNTKKEPRVFYMDTFHDQEASSLEMWKSYNLYLENIEDITYRRFNKYLAKKLYDASQGFYSLKSTDTTDPTIKALLETNSGATMDISNAPDITTKDIIEKSVKQFFEVLNTKYMGDVLRYVHNTGRYGDANNVRVDSVPVVIAKKDLFMRTSLKDVNTSLEGAIDNLVRTKLAQPMRIATGYKVTTDKYTTSSSTSSAGGSSLTGRNSLTSSTGSLQKDTQVREYKNYFFGQEASTITDTKQCTIVRGSTLKVESNRGYNVNNVEKDITFLNTDQPGGGCFNGTTASTNSYWGGNSPLNLNQNAIKQGDIVLGSHVYKNFVVSIYDVLGSRELSSTSSLHTATPSDCLVNNMLLQPYIDETTDSRGMKKSTGWPTETNGTRFSCITTHKPLATTFLDYNTYKKNGFPAENLCTVSILELDGKAMKQSGDYCSAKNGTENITKLYSFKTLTGTIMEHKSPTDEEYGGELKQIVTPSLPSDRDRYVDYLDTQAAYKKIVYPNLFRITLTGKELNYAGAQAKIKSVLDAKTSELKALGGNLDLFQLLSSDDKILNTVIEGVLWNNMKNATLKYSSTLERSLNIDGEKKIRADNSKNDYEIAYLGAPGDAKNMYLKVDPEAKGLFPKEISDILDAVNTYHGIIDGTNITNVSTEPEFTCGPPEGVPIWQWLPAVFCWLGTILPPTISAGSCGGKTIGDKTTSTFSTPANSLDGNQNGVLDGYELIGSPSGALKLQNSGKIFGYNETIPLTAELTHAGKIIDIDDFNVVSFELKKLAITATGSNNSYKVVYDRESTGDLANITNANQYINFKPLGVRANHGIANYAFSSKDTDIDVVFDAHILTKDRYGRTIVDKTATPVTFSIRSLRIAVESKVKSGDSSFVSSTVVSAGNTNGILFNLRKVNKDQIVLAESFPYTLRVYDDITNQMVGEPINVTKNNYLFRDAKILNTSGVYRFEFTDKQGIRGFTTITVLAALPTKIEVTPTSNIFIAGQKTTVMVRVLDSFGNLAQGEVYKLTGSISGGAGFVSADNQASTSTVSTNIIQGYTSFEITNPKTSKDIRLSFRIDRANIASETVTLQSIDFAKTVIEVADKTNIVVGKDKHKVTIKIQDKNNQILAGYNGIAALDFPKLSGSFSTPFVHIKNGISEGDIYLTPGYVAEKNIRIQAQIPGMTNIEGDTVTVLPDTPMSFSFATQNARTEARDGNTENTRATLYDRYGNIAYNTLGYRLLVSIPLESQKYATLATKSPTTSGTGVVQMDSVLQNILSRLSSDDITSITSSSGQKNSSDVIESIIARLGADATISADSGVTNKNIENVLKSITDTLSASGNTTTLSSPSSSASNKSIEDVLKSITDTLSASGASSSSTQSTSSALYAFSGGVLDFAIGATALPGRAYIIGKVVPGLESHTFTVTDKSNKNLVVSGISQNITILDTYYVFNKSKIDTIRYDAQYTTLLGGEYGDVTVPEYLGGEILFNHDSKSLAVTTLLNNPWQDKTIFGITPAGKYSLGNNKDELDSLQTSIGDNGTKSYISFYDSYRKEYIARAWLNLNPSVTSYIPCTSSGTSISDCAIGSNATVFLKGFDDNTAVTNSDGLTLFSATKIPLLQIHKSGKMEKYPGIEIELDDTVSSNLLGMKLVSNGAEVGYLGMKFSGDSVVVTNPSRLPSALATYKNTIVVETLSSRYTARKTHLGISSKGSEGVVFSFNETSGNAIGTLDQSYLAKSGQRGLEDYQNKAGIGWEDTSRMLLEVAAGTTVGNATKFYQTFSTIVLGDAVSHLPKIVTSSNFDRTIGTQIVTGNGEQIESYNKIDANGDGISDIVVFYESGKIQLLINYSGSFKDMGYLAYVSDAGKGRKGVGDFFGDHYEDIALVDNKGKLVVLENQGGKFARTTPIIVSESGIPDHLNGYVQQLEIFDMDKDGRADLVTLDDSGEINILYGEVQNNGAHVFKKHLIEKGLGLHLSKEIRTDGGAFSYSGLTFPSQNTGASASNTSTGANNQEMADNLIYYQYAYDSDNLTVANNQKVAIESAIGTDIETNTTDTAAASNIAALIAKTRTLAGPGNTDFSALESSHRDTKKTFIRSLFAEGKGLKVEKKYTLMTAASRDTIQSGDTVQVELTLTNSGNKAWENAVYLDSNDRNIFSEEHTGNYTFAKNGAAAEQKPLKYLMDGDFDYGFDLGNIAASETITIKYLVSVNPTSYGKMSVGLLEKGELGDDIYGDISLSPNNTCGGELTVWRSVEPFTPLARNYQKGTKKLVDNSILPEELQKNTIDTDNNGIPDYIDDLIKSGTGDTSLLQKYSEAELAKYNIDKNGNKIPDRGDSKGSNVVSYDATSGKIQVGGLTSGNIDAINGQIDEVVKGLGCGFGGGGCLSLPLNWAPLAPGSTPTVFGYPLGLLTPFTGIPTFSAFTFCGPQSPTTWPPCPMGAGGIFGYAPGPFRLFITPTITGAVGTAVCFGDNLGSGFLPPPGVSPLIPGGNCIVAAKPLQSCKDDGSDGDAGSLGLGINSGNSYVNANSCVQVSNAGKNNALLPEDRNNLVAYVRGDTSRLPEINASIAKGGLSSFSVGPLVTIGAGEEGDSNLDVSIDSAALKNFDFGSIIKIKNTRVSAFPDFLMEWATRQLEEVVNKLTSLPTLYVIFPDFSGFDLSGYKDFPKKFAEGKSADKTDYTASLQAKSSSNTTLDAAKSGYNSLVNNNADTINSFGKNISGVKAAYDFMSHLPLLKLETEMVDISVPWLSFEEMDKWLIDAKLKQKQWKAELSSKQEQWSRLGTASGADNQVILRTEGLLSTLQENISVIEDYKKFPEKLQKYLTWKERYASQLLCNFEAIESMMGGWISDNGKRFRTWVELYILIKAILKGWQAIVDLFTGYEQECATCNNERYDLKHFIFKLISAIIPKIPIIQFPKWPDIWLDLHNIRGGLNILMPEYHFNFVPMVLPELPDLHLPNVPTLGVGLPNLPVLPRLPNLPDLPDLPSLPNIKLPDLPPPPTIPKLFGGIAAVLEIFKIVAKILCIMRTNPFVPEWRAGDQIAQMTERQGTLPIDFLNIEFPNFSFSFIDAIKVGSFVNLEMDLDFIVAMSKATLDPLNRFTNDFSNLGAIQIPDVNLGNTVPSQVEVTVGKPESYNNTKTTKPTKNETMTYLLGKLSYEIVQNFMALNTYVAKHSKEEVTVEGLREILTENITLLRATHDAKAIAIADSLQKAVTYPGESEKKFILSLQKENTEKFRLLKDYVKGEQTETLRLKTEIDTILRTGILDQETTPSFVSIGAEHIKTQALSTDSGFSDALQSKILGTNDSILSSMKQIQKGVPDSEVKEIQDIGSDLTSGVDAGLASFAKDLAKNDSEHRLAYADSTNTLLSLSSTDVGNVLNTISTTLSTDATSNASSTNINSPKYQYEGIYILDKNKKQVRLFDYIDDVDGTEELVYADTDKDGDDDILYRMNNSLYLKQNFDKTLSVRHIFDSPKVLSVNDFLHISSASSHIFSAPNHFEETFGSTREIAFSFLPSDMVTDNLMRLEYYDYVDRFDKIKSGENSLSIAPGTSIHKVDLIPDISSETTTDVSHTGFVGRKNAVSFGRGSGEATVRMNSYQYITPTTNGANNPIIITEGRTVYTDAGGATISYVLDGDTTPHTLTFAARTNYEFLKNTTISVLTGKLYLFKASEEQRTVNMGDLFGMPVSPNTHVELSNKNSYATFSYFDGSTMTLNGPGTYEYYPLGKKKDTYSVSISAPNDWYYAKLYSIHNGIQSTSALLHLLSPQKEADTEGPLITYGDAIRVPVYQQQLLNLNSYIDDISSIDNIWMDMDLTKDTDGDGDVSNDKDTLNPSTSYGVKKGNTLFDFKIGPFDTLFTKKVRLYVEDGNENISSKDLTLTVYSPVPAIQSLSGSRISGNMNESLSGEPIDVFRLRNGILARIEPSDTTPTKTQGDGAFSTMTKNSSGIILSGSGKTIATIDERTGKIALEDTSFQVTVSPATKNAPMEIRVLSGMKELIYTQKINISPISRVESVTNLDNLTATGIFIAPNTGFSFIKNTTTSPNLPNGGYVTDTQKKAIAGISAGGDIYILDSKYQLSYTTKDSHILIRLKDSSGNIAANFLYKIQAEYIIK